MRHRRHGYPVLLALAFTPTAAPLTAQSFPPAPTDAEIAEVRELITGMKADERGPYLRIRWFCNDGTVQPPQPPGCRERGGGHQHAELGPRARRLEDLGYHVGTILQDTPYEEFADTARAGYRLREIVMERHLFQVDDGWVLRRARYYRGALQIEDEERSGRELLARRLANGRWLRENYFLAARLVEVLPHTGIGTGNTTERVRALATEVADLDPGFMRLRVKIHSVPSRDDLPAVESYLARGGHAEEVRLRLEALRDALRVQYDSGQTRASLEAFARHLGAEWAIQLQPVRQALASGDVAGEWTALARLAPRVRESAESAPSGHRALDLMDLGAVLHARAFVIAPSLDPVADRRSALLRFVESVDLAYAAGYVSGRERLALTEVATDLSTRASVTALDYKNSVGYLSRALDWARGTVRGTFLPVLDRYVPVEPSAAGLPDALLRGSILLPLSHLLDELQSDADAALGATHMILGQPTAQGVRGLNPGVALRRLEFLESGHEDDVDAGTIYVLPETPPELKPVAGVLTLAEGNLLSHVQLLARNLGIPNATVAPELGPRLRAAEGLEVFYAVTPLGRVIVKFPEALTPEEAALIVSGQPTEASRYSLDTSRLRLDRVRPIPISELRSELSGVVVGPKAANLGQLSTDFPGRVSSAAALPFGMFLRHVSRPWSGSEGTVMEELRDAYARAREMRATGAPEADVNAYMLERLTWVRDAIVGLEWVPELREQVVRVLLDVVGGEPARGVFVRSDTNVEDLPQFSGAGLNLTVPHQTSVEDVLASVKRVWTSPFTERAYLWRSQILDEQGEVYPSVLLQESIASDKSGVLITSGLQEGGAEDLTVVVAEGVGGAVEGEDAETLLVGPDGSVRLLSQAKAPRRRELRAGGTRWVAATRPDTLLQPRELDQLRDVVASWRAKMVGTPDEDTVWDMEFGFRDGQLWLFQVRPFVRLRNSDLYRDLEALDRDARENAGRIVRLTDPLGDDR